MVNTSGNCSQKFASLLRFKSLWLNLMSRKNLLYNLVAGFILFSMNVILKALNALQIEKNRKSHINNYSVE